MAERGAALNFILKLTDQVTSPLSKVKMGFADLSAKGQRSITQMGVGLAGMVGAGVAITESLQPALEMNRRLAEVRSLGVAEDVLDRLNSKALEFSVAYGENAQEFVASAYDIQGAISGLVGSELATFTNASAIMAKATKASATTMSDYVGTMYGIFQKQADAMGKENWINDLASQTSYALNIFKTDGEGMSQAFTSLGASATSAGIALTEQMGILGTLQATMSGGEAGTKYKAFLAGVGSAQKELGLSFTDSQGRMLPMLSILEKIKGKVGDTLSVAESDQLKKAFGSDEAMALIQLLLPQIGSLGDSIEALGKIKGLDYATNMAKTMVDPWKRFGAAVEALRISFGQVLIPILSPLMDRLTNIASTLTRWIKLFPNISRWIGMITLGIVGLVAVTGGLTLLGGLFGTLSLLASPIALLVIGIAALVAIVGAAIYWWGDLKAAFGETSWFQALVAVLTPVVLLFRALPVLLGMMWNGLVQLVGYGAQFVAWLSQLESVTAAAKAIWDLFIWGLTNLSPFALLGNALKYLIGLLNKIPGIQIDTSFGELPQAPEMPGASKAPVSAPNTPATGLALSRAMPPDVMTTQPLAMPPQPAPQATPPLVVAPQPVIQAAPPLVIAPQPAPQAAPPLVVAPQPVIQAAPPLVIAPQPAPQATPPLVVAPQPVIQAAPPLVIAPQTAPQAAPPLVIASQPAIHIAPPMVVTPPPAIQATPPLVIAQQPADRTEQAQQRINRPLAELAPQRPTAVPPGGLLASIQNTQTQNKGTHVEKIEIHTSKPMTPLELENMLEMSAG